jgi:hypothetical protein
MIRAKDVKAKSWHHPAGSGISWHDLLAPQSRICGCPVTVVAVANTSLVPDPETKEEIVAVVRGSAGPGLVVWLAES